LAARLLGMPLLVHEQNAVLGSTNKLLQYLADRRLEAFPNTFSRRVATYFTGNPVRFEAAEAKGENAETRRVLIVGGSRGAQALNENMPALLGEIAGETGLKLSVMHQTGERDVELVKQRYADGSCEVTVQAFIEDMATAYAQADLVVCRSGAMTVAELAVAGRAAVLVPFPHAIDDHQTKNAQWLVEQGGAMLLPQNMLQQSVAKTQLLQLLSDKEKLSSMAAASKKAAIEDAASNVASHCMEVCA
jgi:UDP-N-acetylglucosamine--N-acetylmuramyl-(pentapeptide) pyrophosphoryl-undecaprenol N-acetylglucosamine transferase